MERRKLISVTDTQYSGALLTSLNEQRMEGIFCDVTVVVEDKKFRAHRNILSASSTYFHHLFSVPCQVVELNIVRAEIFEEILNYIYSSKLVRVRSNLLEELINSGKILGVKFIADLGIPLSQVKNMGGCAKNNCVEASSSNLNKNVLEIDKSAIEAPAKDVLTKENDISTEPIVPKAVVTSNEYVKGPDKPSECEDKGKDIDDDVIFCSELVPPKLTGLNSMEITPKSTSPDVVEVPTQQLTNSSASAESPSKSSSNLPSEGTIPAQPSSSVNISSPIQKPASVATFGPFQNHVMPSTLLLSQNPFNSSGTNYLSWQNLVPTTNMVVQQLPMNSNFSMKPIIIPNSSCASSPDLSLTPFIHRTNIEKMTGFNALGLQSPQMATFTEKKISKPGELKIKIKNIHPENGKDCLVDSGTVSQHIMDGKKIITLDTPTDIGGLSTGCKVYANIGEDTYDIVIPIKEDPDEDDGAVELPRSIDGSPDSKRVKIKHEDHYELSVDGRVYYICIVCKRSYEGLTSLKRHYNCHSWEKKYPCHYCEKVFPMAEYRTKHEILHTGEKRYQCLTCGKLFINYQVMSSHIRSVHNLDPTRDPKIYHLHPCKTLPIRPYNYAHNANPDPSSSAPERNDAGLVYNVDKVKEEVTSEEKKSSSPPKPMNWEDAFEPHGGQHIPKSSTSDCSTEFEFVIPESY
ncbi:transcriptional regulator Kaiso-like isoform X3 [Lissotriton helveticus]